MAVTSRLEIGTLLLGTLMYRSRLVPRPIPTLGLIGAPLLLASVAASAFGIFDQFSSIALVAALPLALRELSLGLWLEIKGFRSVPMITA